MATVDAAGEYLFWPPAASNSSLSPRPSKEESSRHNAPSTSGRAVRFFAKWRNHSLPTVREVSGKQKPSSEDLR